MSKTLEALKAMCETCHRNIQAQPSKGMLPHKECPWRHISNDYCEEYEVVRKNLMLLELLKKQGIALVIPNNDFSKEHLTIEVYSNTLTKKEWEALKELFNAI